MIYYISLCKIFNNLFFYIFRFILGDCDVLRSLSCLPITHYVNVLLQFTSCVPETLVFPQYPSYICI